VKVSRPVGLGLPSSSHCGHALSCLPFHSQSGGNCSSPISRFGQRLVTLTTSLFTPGFAAAVTFTRNGGFQSTPRFLPVQGNFGEIFHRAEIEPEFAPGGQPFGGISISFS
jgi:hypothetical protein